MTTMSKNAVPSLLRMASKSFKVAISCICFGSFGSPEQKQDEALLKQTNSYGWISVLKLTAPQVLKDDRLVAYSDQKKVQASVLKGKLNLNLFQGLYERNGFKIQSFGKDMNVCIAISKDVVAIIVSNRFKDSYAKNEYGTFLFQMITVTYGDLLEKFLQSVFVKPANLFLKQLSLETETPNGSKDICKIDEKPDITNNLNNYKESQTCYKCLEQIKGKMYFDERRFGILENCDCMICYGCIRKAGRNSHGVVKGPVDCPVCSIKSNNVVSSARWIEGKEKVKFFEEYFKNMLEFTPSPATKDVANTKNQFTKYDISTRNSPIRKYDIWVGKHFTLSTTNDKWTGNSPTKKSVLVKNRFTLPTRNDDKWTGSFPVEKSDLGTENNFTFLARVDDKLTGSFPNKKSGLGTGNNFTIPTGNVKWTGSFPTEMSDVWAKALPMVPVN